MSNFREDLKQAKEQMKKLNKDYDQDKGKLASLDILKGQIKSLELQIKNHPNYRPE